MDKKRLFTYCLCFIAAAVIGLYFRLYPLFYYTPHDIKEKAASLVVSTLKKHVIATVDQQHPELNAIKKSYLAKTLLDNLIREQSGQIKKRIILVSQDLKKRLPPGNAYPYLLASDSFYYYSLTKNIQKTGKIAKEFKGSKYLNERMTAPEGHWEPINLHPYIGYFVFKCASVIRPNIPLMFGVSFTPLVIMILSLGLFFILCFKFEYGTLETFIGSVYFILAPIYIRRSALGWYDNDPYNILFPLAILLCFFTGLRSKKYPLFALLTSLLIGIYALFWQGWMYLFCIILASISAILIYSFIVQKDYSSVKSILIYLGLLALGSFFFIAAIFGIKEFFVLFNEGWQALKNFLSPQLRAWPDLFMNVGELRKISASKFAELTGGPVFLAGALIGLLKCFWGLFRLPKDKKSDEIITLSIFLIFSILVTLGAQRFALLALIPLGFLFPIGVKTVYDFLEHYALKRIHNKKKIVQVSLTIAACLVLLNPVIKTHNMMLEWQPIFNETWASVLTKIKNETPKDSIVNAWWPPGHFITAMGERQVTFDGATINKPQAYWLASAFLSSDEKHALGLLRMLNNSANQAVEYLKKQKLSLSTCVNVLQEIASLDKKQSTAQLREILPEERIQPLLTLTHSFPPPTYFLIYNENLEKNIEFGFISQWDFKKIEAINLSKESLKRVPARNSKEYVQYLWGLVGRPLRYSGPLSQLAIKENFVIFDQNIQVNLNNMTCRINSDKFGKGVPLSVFYLKGNRIIENIQKDANLKFCAVLLNENSQYRVILMSRKLAQSLMVKLFFFKGKGLRYFEPWIEEKDLTGRTHIFVYKVNWGKFFRNKDGL